MSKLTGGKRGRCERELCIRHGGIRNECTVKCTVLLRRQRPREVAAWKCQAGQARLQSEASPGLGKVRMISRESSGVLPSRVRALHPAQGWCIYEVRTYIVKVHLWSVGFAGEDLVIWPCRFPCVFECKEYFLCVCHRTKTKREPTRLRNRHRPTTKMATPATE